jgi:hypothetical protein
MNSKQTILKAYRKLIKTAYTLESYNYRDFALRKIKYEFRTKKEFDIKKVEESIKQMNRIHNIYDMYKGISV